MEERHSWRVPASEARRPRVQAAYGEAFVWSFAVGTLAFGLTLNPRVGMGVWTAGFVVYVVQWMTSRTNERAGAGQQEADAGGARRR